MSEKRLEEIKNKHADLLPFALGISVDRNDFIWLVKQAERAQEIDGYTQKYVTLLKLYWEENERLRKVVQRTEKALGQSK